MNLLSNLFIIENVLLNWVSTAGTLRLLEATMGHILTGFMYLMQLFIFYTWEMNNFFSNCQIIYSLKFMAPSEGNTFTKTSCEFMHIWKQTQRKYVEQVPHVFHKGWHWKMVCICLYYTVRMHKFFNVLHLSIECTHAKSAESI